MGQESRASSITMAGSNAPGKETPDQRPSSDTAPRPLTPIKSQPNPPEVYSTTSHENGSTDTEKATPAAAPAAAAGPPAMTFPDGGLQAWLTILGGFCCLFVSFGWINAVGVFQDYYQTDLLRTYSPSTISWIVSLEIFFMFAGGPVIGWLFDSYGPRHILAVGSVLHVFGLMMASLSTEYYQLLLSQGVCSPLGASMIFTSAMSSVVSWFQKRRALALGIVASGSSLGGIIFPIMVQHLIPQVGFPWAMRTAAFVILALLLVANATVRSRFPHRPRPFSVMAFVRPLGEPAFALLAAASFLIFFGLLVPFNYISLSALRLGMSPHLAEYLIPILNAASIFGRTLPGYAGDKLGKFNVTVTMCGMSGILTLALWLPARANAPLIVYAVFYGFGSGAFVSMMPALVAQISDVRQIGTRVGTVFAVVSVAALCGNPIGGALLVDDKGAFTYLQAFSGSTVVGGTLVLLATRMLVTKGKLLTRI